MLAIIFSHHTLIEEMIEGAGGPGQGIIRRNRFTREKSFTNLKNDFEELGFASFLNRDEVGFDLRPILLDDKLGGLAMELFRLKLKDANWVGEDVVECALESQFNKALGIQPEEFQKWLVGGLTFADKIQVGFPDSDIETKKAFLFKSGHKPKKTGQVELSERITKRFAILLHNEIQTVVFGWLVETYGAGNVGSEVSTGSGDTAVDLVLKKGTELTFYEIKTNSSLKGCIREALPQLMEYAYWPAEKRATALVILSKNIPTKDAQLYLTRLRNDFGIPVYHETVNTLTGTLSNRI